MNLSVYKNIIFDLGGVLLRLDYNASKEAFEKLGITNFNDLFSQAQQTGLFDEYETGKCSTPYFINKLLEKLPIGTTPNQVVAAWNAMIFDFPSDNLAYLQELKNSHRLFLLSNTNDIHIQAVHRALEKACGEKSLAVFFEKAYFSSDIGLRKPHVEIFDFVCHENQLIPSETLFIDDTEQHIRGAEKAGLNFFLFPQNELLRSVFEK
jgi:FMN phosphatase YigB (HAD superfamily)